MEELEGELLEEGSSGLRTAYEARHVAHRLLVGSGRGALCPGDRWLAAPAGGAVTVVDLQNGTRCGRLQLEEEEEVAALAVCPSSHSDNHLSHAIMLLVATSTLLLRHYRLSDGVFECLKRLTLLALSFFFFFFSRHD